MPGGKPVNVRPWSGWFRLAQVDWLRSHSGGGVTQSDMVRDAVDLVIALVDENAERAQDIANYIRARYGKDRHDG